MITITLADGTEIGNLRVNGDNFISSVPINESIFVNNTSPVTIHDSNSVPEIHDHMELLQLIRYNNEYWFVLRDLTQEELRQIDIDAKLDYIAMMADVDLEDFDV